MRAVPVATLTLIMVCVHGIAPACLVFGQQSNLRSPVSRLPISQVGWTDSPPVSSSNYSSRRAPQERISAEQLSPTASPISPPILSQNQGETMTAETWDLEFVESLALESNPGLAEAASRIQAAQGGVIQAGLPPNPEIGYMGDDLGSGDSDKNGFVVQKQFVRGGKLALDQAVECEELNWRQVDWSRQRQRVITDVRMAFYEVLISERRLQLARHLQQILSQAMSAAQSLFDIKEGNKVDVLQAQIELDTATAAVQQAEFEYANAWRRMGNLIGRPGQPPQTLVGSVEEEPPLLNFDEVWVQLQTQSPELMLAQIAIDKACQELRRAQVEPIPDVTVQAGLMYDNEMNGVNGNVQIMFPLPTVDRNQGRIQQAAAEWQAAQDALARKRLALFSALSDIFARYATAQNQVQIYREQILPKAAENLELSRRGYEAGEFNFIQVLMVQRTFTEKNSNYLDALRQMWALRLEIQGLLLKNSLTAME